MKQPSSTKPYLAPKPPQCKNSTPNSPFSHNAKWNADVFYFQTVEPKQTHAVVSTSMDYDYEDDFDDYEDDFEEFDPDCDGVEPDIKTSLNPNGQSTKLGPSFDLKSV
jgi:hypothetical protein